jgi:chaperonin GroES
MAIVKRGALSPAEMQRAIDDRKVVSLAGTSDWEPMHDRLLVKRFPDQERVGAIYIPEDARRHTENYSARGVVLKVGPGRRDEDGTRIPCDVRPGAEIIFGRWTDWELFGQDVVLIQEADIRVVVTNETIKRSAKTAAR